VGNAYHRILWDEIKEVKICNMHTYIYSSVKKTTDPKKNAALMAHNISNWILMCFNATFNNQGYYKIR